MARLNHSWHRMPPKNNRTYYTSYICPVCEKPKAGKNHTKCSRILQQQYSEREAKGLPNNG